MSISAASDHGYIHDMTLYALAGRHKFTWIFGENTANHLWIFRFVRVYLALHKLTRISVYNHASDLPHRQRGIQKETQNAKLPESQCF